MRREKKIFQGKRKVAALNYNPLYGTLTIEFQDGKDKIFISDMEESLIKGKKREELQLESITVRKKKRGTGSEIDFYYNIKLQFCNAFIILVRGNINKKFPNILKDKILQNVIK